MSPGPDKAAPPDPSVFNVPDPGASPFAQRLTSAFAGRFTGLAEIGRGGSSFVFRAVDPRRASDVAIKVLRPELSAAVDESRFEREIEIAGRLQHPNILPALESGSVDGSLFYTMPFVHGETLRTRLRARRQLPLSETMAIARHVASALDHAHANGVIHRDIKPANILIGESTTVVADFGIARAMTVAAGEAITESGVSVGTPEYMSPEQGLGHRELDARSDIYALGCVVYEMLAGEPPFTGPTAQAIVARHCREVPHSLRVIRPAIPFGVERAVETALAKTPVDRFQTATAFIEALEAGMATVDEPRGLRALSLRARVAVGVVVIAVAITGVLAISALRHPALDANRVIVFPLYDRASPADGEGVANYIGNALANTRPLTWVDGWELLTPGERSRGERLAPTEARRLARNKGARYFIDGTIRRDQDSTRIALVLHDAEGDSITGSGTAAAPAEQAVLPVLGLAAAGGLLPALLKPGGVLNVGALDDRKPRAIANFLQGEREYRRMQFRPALAHYEAALGEDSAFTLAAFRGAETANWLNENAVALRLAKVAVDRADNLPASQVHVARGLQAALSGSADSAIAHFTRAIAIDPNVHGAWTLLGETYLRLLPNIAPADSLAYAALDRARTEDPDFAPTLVLLESMALHDGKVREALRLREELKRAGADSSHAFSRDIMLRCVRDGPSAVDLPGALRLDKLAVIAAAKFLDARAEQPACAIAIYTAVLDAADIEPGYRWAAFLGLQSQFAATARNEDAAALFSWHGTANLPLRLGYLTVAMAGGGFESTATAIADTAARQKYDRLVSPTLWMLGAWEARRNNRDRVRDISRVLRHKADSSRSRRDDLLARAIAARVRLLNGDTAAAIAALRALSPSAPRSDISWVPWESLAAERMLLAELLFARKQFFEAGRVAALIDAPEPVIHPLYLRPSLELRARAADSSGLPGFASTYRRRLAALAKR